MNRDIIKQENDLVRIFFRFWYSLGFLYYKLKQTMKLLESFQVCFIFIFFLSTFKFTKPIYFLRKYLKLFIIIFFLFARISYSFKYCAYSNQASNNFFFHLLVYAFFFLHDTCVSSLTSQFSVNNAVPEVQTRNNCSDVPQCCI